MNEEDPTRRMTIMMLPDDLVLNCLARVSRLYYPTLSSVSKRFRSLVASTELYQTRSILGRTESCLYVCLWLCPDSNPLRWFTLSRTSKKMILVPISAHNFPSGAGSEVAVVGPLIYALGGLGYYASSRVMVMDSRSHKWREAPSMQVARVSQSACVLDGKIYVTGGCLDLDSTNWMEVFDTKTQTWEFLQIPSEKICKGSMYESVRFEGTIYVRSEVTDVTYKLNKGRWREADIAVNRRWGRSSSHCVIDNVFYCYDICNTIDWYDSNLRFWKRLKGLEKFISTRLSTSDRVKLTDYGGKMVILWEEYKNHHRTEKLIWCADIAIEKRQNGEIWGMLEWFDVVSTTNGTSSLAHALTTTI